MQDYYIGLMSGTSLDGADGVLVDFSGPKPQVMAAASEPFADAFRAELLALNAPTHDELHRAALAGPFRSIRLMRQSARPRRQTPPPATTLCCRPHISMLMIHPRGR